MTNNPVALMPTHSTRVLADDPFITFLKSLSYQHVHVFPKSGNAGDGVISYAMYLLFKEFCITFTAHRQEDTVEGETVLIGGGGNLIEGRYNDVAELIRRHAEKNRVVLMPHTIVGFKDVLAKTHESLTVFCREPVSYRLALLNGANPHRTHLSHDLVFFLEDDHFAPFFQEGEGTLKALRRDGEASGTIPIPPENIDISLSWNGDIWTSPDFCANVTQSMAAFISPFATVQTDRLHVSILSAFLKKHVSLLPNSYFKNRAVFEHSIQLRFPNLTFINTMPTIEGPPSPVVAQLQEAAVQTLAKDVAETERNEAVALVAELRGQLASALGMLAERTAQAESATEEFNVLKSRLAHADRAAEHAVQLRENSERSFELRQQALRERVAELARENEELRSELARETSELSRQCGSLNVEVERLRREASEQHQRAETLRNDLTAVLTSTSWRMSRPLRSIIVRSRTLLRGSR